MNFIPDAQSLKRNNEFNVRVGLHDNGASIVVRSITNVLRRPPEISTTVVPSGLGHSKYGRTGFIPRNDFRPVLVTETIVKSAHDYKHYEIGGRTMRDLPEYDDCKDYTDNNIQDLTSAEVQKLAAIASDDTPPLFDSLKSFPGISQKDFENLSGIADQLVCNLSLLFHDNSRYGLQVPTIASLAWEVMIETRRNLRLRYRQTETLQTVEGRAPRMIPDKKTNYQAYSKLLDYVLGTMCWWLMRCAQSEYWNKHLIAILAKWSVKLKIVAFDPQTSVAESLDKTQEAIESMKAEAELRETMIKVGGKERDITTFDTEADISNLYFEEKMELRENLAGIFIAILDALMVQERSGSDPDYFEVCSLIYWARDQDITNMTMGYRHGNISTSSIVRHINYGHSALQLLEHNTQSIHASRTDVSPQSSDLNYLKVSHKKWSAVSGIPGKPFETSLYSMDEVVSVLVPLSLLDGKVTRLASFLVEFTNSTADSRDIIQRVAPPENDYFSEYVLSTKSWLEQNDPSGIATTADIDVQHLSQSPIRIGLVGASPRGSDDLPSISELRKDYRKHVEYMEKWDCRAGTVVIKCKTYARISQTIAALVVIGGLVIPFTVLDRIAGVDPFNITMFTWLLSGFVLVVAKSLYVSDWPWYDFLAGRVECTRLSDLADVSGIGTQIVLLFFLQRDASSRFVTQGPYNGVFRRQLNLDRKGERNTKREHEENSVSSMVQTGGFVIDRSINLWTLMAAGFIMLKVLNANGEHLVCIDGRKGGWDAARQGREGNWLTCPDYNLYAQELAHGGIKAGTGKKGDVFILERKTFRWTKVLGVYVEESKFG